MRKFKLKKSDLHKSLPNLANLDSVTDGKPSSWMPLDHWANNTTTGVHHTGSALSLNENGSLLDGRIQLRILLPNGTPIRMNVEAKTPMMDLLVQVTTANGINPGGMCLKVPTDRPPGCLHYKPSTPIGTLNCDTLEVVPKFDVCERPRKQTPKTANLPFEPTVRIQVDLPKNQKSVFRLSPQLSLYDIHRRVCQETKYDIDSYELRTSKCPGLPLDLSVKLCEAGTVSFVLVSSKANLSKSTGDLFGLYTRMPIEEKEKHKSRGFFWFLRRKKPKRKASLEGPGKGSDPNLSSARNADSLLRDKRLKPGLTTTDRPLSLQFLKEDGLIADAPADANDVENHVWHRHLKKRQAPKPPVETVQTKVIQPPLSAYAVNNETVDDVVVGEPSKKTHHRINERRHSDSTSSGYHGEDSLAQSPSPELVILDKQQTCATDSSYVERSVSEKSGSSGASSSIENRPVVPIETTFVRDRLGKRISSSDIAIAESESKRKSHAPPPPPVQSEEKLNLIAGVLEKFHDGLEPESMTEDKLHSSTYTSRSSSPATVEEVDQNFQQVIQQMEAELSAEKENRHVKPTSLYHIEVDNHLFQLPVDTNDKLDKILSQTLSSKIGPSRVFAEPIDSDNLNRSFNENVQRRTLDDPDSRIDKLISGKYQRPVGSAITSTTDLGLEEDWSPKYDSTFNALDNNRQRIPIEPDVVIVRENFGVKPTSMNPVLTNLTDDWEPKYSTVKQFTEDGFDQPRKLHETNFIDNSAGEPRNYSQTYFEPRPVRGEEIALQMMTPITTNLDDDWSPKFNAIAEPEVEQYRPPITARATKQSPNKYIEGTTTDYRPAELSYVAKPSVPVNTGLNDDWAPQINESVEGYYDSNKHVNEHQPSYIETPNYKADQSLMKSNSAQNLAEEVLQARSDFAIRPGLEDDWIPEVSDQQSIDVKPPIPKTPPPLEETVAAGVVGRSSASAGFDNPPLYKRKIITGPSPKSTVSSVDSPLKLNIVDMSENWSSISSPKYRYDYNNSPRTTLSTMSPRPYQPISPQSRIAVRDPKRNYYPSMTVKNFEDEYYAKEMKDEYMRRMKYGIIEDERNEDVIRGDESFRSLPSSQPGNTLPRVTERRRTTEISVNVASPKSDKSTPEKKQVTQKTFTATPVVAVGGDERENMLYREYDKLQAMFAVWQERLKQNEAVIKRGEKLSALDILEFQRVQGAMMDQHKLVQKLCPEDKQKALEKMNEEVSARYVKGDEDFIYKTAPVSQQLFDENDKRVSYPIQNGPAKISSPPKEDKFRQQTFDVIRSSRHPDGYNDYHELRPSDNLLNDDTESTHSFERTPNYLLNDTETTNSFVDTSSILKPTQLVAAKKYFESPESKPVINDNLIMKVNDDKTQNVFDNQERRKEGEEDYGYGFGNLVSKTIYVSNPKATSRRSEIPSGLYVSKVNFSPQHDVQNVESHSSAVYYDVQIRESRVIEPTKRDSRITYFIPPPPVPTSVSMISDPKNVSGRVVTTIVHDQNSISADDLNSRDSLLRSIRDFDSANHLKRV